ncbi:hypothetical protein CA51_22670 [Rosistilla oblonga]|nr:hypothetical protein CA51_22670 [Rosistilla oblonga]
MKVYTANVSARTKHVTMCFSVKPRAIQAAQKFKTRGVAHAVKLEDSLLAA